MNVYFFGACLLFAAVAEGVPGELVFGFETSEERNRIKTRLQGDACGAVKDFPSEGEWSLAFCPPKWRRGLEEWPSVTLEVPEGMRDWSGYSRISMDLVSFGGGYDLIKCFIAPPEGPVSRGALIDVTLPKEGTRKWEVPLSAISTQTDLRNVGRLHFYATRPRDCRVYIDNIRLSSSVKISVASGMEKVRPRDVRERSLAECVNVRLARNETECVQLLIQPLEGLLRNVKVKAGVLKHTVNRNCSFPENGIRIAPVGFVKTQFEPPYVVYPDLEPAEIGWWPDPILSFLDAVDVADGDWQSFWVSVSCGERQLPGEYRGMLSISADRMDAVDIPFSVRVNGFALPKTPVVPVCVSFNPGNRAHTMGNEASKAANADPDSPVNAWKQCRNEWIDFLADRLMPPFSLYGRGFSGVTDIDGIARLSAQGRAGLINIGYWSYPAGTDAVSVARWRDATIPRLKKSWSEIVDRGWEARACLYGCDEVAEPQFDRVRIAADEIAAAFPGVPLCSTAFDHGYGTQKNSLRTVDYFIPRIDSYDEEMAAKARIQGKKVWWYVCLAPCAPYPNMFVESTGIETRLLMGAMIQKFRPDGFLYYQSAIWNSEHCISSGPYTDWNPRSFRFYHGDGSWTCVGPGGLPLSTIRLENFRDGLEDLAYARLLEKKTGKLVKVPESVVRSLTGFTLDPAELLRWRDHMADMLEDILGDVSRGKPQEE